MTHEEAKEKLHFLVEKVDEKKVMAMLTLLENKAEDETEYTYDDETIAQWEQESEDILSGKTKTYTLDESIEDLKKHRAQRGL